MSKKRYNKKTGNEEQNLTAIFGLELVGGFIDGNAVSVEQASDEIEEYCKEFCMLYHVFYDIIYKSKDKLESRNFYINSSNSPCILKFDNLFHKEKMTNKMREYAIEEALAMVKSDVEKEQQHIEQIEDWKDELKEIEKKINNIRKRASSAKRKNRLNKLLNKKSHLQKKIDTPFNSKRCFGTKELRRRIERFFFVARKNKINSLVKEAFEEERKTNKNLTYEEVKQRFTSDDTLFTEEELAEQKKEREELKKEFNEKRYGNFKSYGDGNSFRNRFFRIVKEDKTYYIVFQPNKKTKLKFRVTLFHGYEKLLEKMYQMSIVCQVPLTFNLDFYKNQVQISYDPLKLYGKEQWEQIKPVPNRIASIDLNPDEVGFVITDFYGKNGFNVLRAEVFSVEELNNLESELDGQGLKSSDPKRIHLTNKRHYEIDIICKDMMREVSHYSCETFVIENLRFSKAGNTMRGRKFNKLVNKYWCRTRFTANLKRECYLRNVEYKEVNAAFSSFVGNFLFRSLGLPDMCLAALELGRRSYRIKEYYKRHKDQKQKDIPEEERENFILPDLEDFKIFAAESLNEFRFDIIENSKLFSDDVDWVEEIEKDSKGLLKKIYDAIGTKMVRVHLDELLQNSNSKRSIHRLHTEKSHTRRIIFDVKKGKSTYEKNVID